MGDGRSRVVILGGGFGGLTAARRLRRSPVELTLIDKGTHHVLQGLLYQCATGVLSEGQISSPLRSLLRDQANARVVLGNAIAIDPRAQVLIVEGPDGSTFEVEYDYLIVAAGMRQSYFGHDEFARHAPGMKTLDDAMTIRQRVFEAFEIAETKIDENERGDWLTFAVVGAGPTGVELAAQIRELASRTLEHEFRSIRPEDARVLLIDAGSDLLPGFDDHMRVQAKAILGTLGVRTILDTHVTSIDDTGVEVRTRIGTTTRYRTRTVLWAAGVQAAPFVDAFATALGLVQDGNGRIAVNPDLSIPGRPNIWLIGDIAKLDHLPGIATVAMQAGKFAADQVNGAVTNGSDPKQRFRFRDTGTSVYLCRFNALVTVGPIRLSGLVGWLAWGFIHTRRLASRRNRLTVPVIWSLALLSGQRAARTIPRVAPSPMDQEHPNS